MRPSLAQGFGTIGQQVAERHEALASSRRVYSRTAERYWILRSGDDELRFTHRSGAESWANRLAERGRTSELAWHDESDASATEADKSVA